MNSVVIVAVPEVVLVVVSVTLDLDGSDIVKASLVRGEAERHPFAIHCTLADDTISVVSLNEVTAFRPLTYLVKRAPVNHHIELLLTAISIKVLGLRIVIPELYLDGWILGRDGTVVLTLEAAKVIHLGVLVLASAPAVALAAAHLGDIDITPVAAATRIRIISRNGFCCQR